MYALFLLVSFYSLWPTPEQRATHAARQAEKRAEKEKWASTPDGSDAMTPEQQWQHMWELQQLPRTPGTAGGMYLKSPMTPRSRAFGDLEGGGGAVSARIQTPSQLGRACAWPAGGRGRACGE